MGERKGMELVRYATHLMDRCRESFNDRFTAEQILRLADACQRSKWDIFPDDWEERQIQECIQFGKVPEWEEVKANEWGGTKIVGKYHNTADKTFEVAVSMTVTATVKVYADTLEDAVGWAEGDMPTPKDTEYLDDSFEVDKENTEYLNENQDLANSES